MLWEWTRIGDEYKGNSSVRNLEILLRWINLASSEYPWSIM